MDAAAAVDDLMVMRVPAGYCHRVDDGRWLIERRDLESLRPPG
jgi:hypothetical protein